MPVKEPPMRHLIPALFTLLVGISAVSAADPGLQQGDHVAVIGDSITEQKLYSLYIEKRFRRPSKAPIRCRGLRPWW